jgi:hypothetical protein
MNAKRSIVGALASLIVICGAALSAGAGQERVVAEAKSPDTDYVLVPLSANTSAPDRSEKFESEYGIKERSSSPIGRLFQSAKYALDKATFTAEEAAKKLEFTYDIGEPPPSDLGMTPPTPKFSLPLFGTFGHAQLKSEATVHDPQTGVAMFSLKLVIPFGSGGERKTSHAGAGG